MWVLALRFMMTVRGTHKQVLTEYLNIAPEKRAAGYTLPPAWPLIFFDALAGVFFFLSAWAHAFSCMDERLTRLFWMLEKAGITAGENRNFMSFLEITRAEKIYVHGHCY